MTPECQAGPGIGHSAGDQDDPNGNPHDAASLPGPGDLLKPQKVVIGTDAVAVDAYGARRHDRNPRDILLLSKAVGVYVFTLF